MEFEEFQREWQAFKSEPKTHEELRRMMYTPRVWRFRGLTWKEILGLAGNGLIIVGMAIWGHMFEHWYSPPLMLPSLVIVLDQYLGLRYMYFLPQKDTLEETLSEALLHIKRLALISRILHVVIWITLVLILAMNVELGRLNVVLWALILLPVLVAVNLWSSRKWSMKKDEVTALLEDLGEDESLPVV